MKAIVCEMCNSNNLLKENGVFMCQSCGTKYSVEEAKKLMVEIAGNVDVSGSTVKIDNTSNIENYLTLAENALSSKNYAEAEQYSNKIIEIDPGNYRAWLIKGKAAGWQSTTINPRTEESTKCFINAVSLAPNDKRTAVSENAADELSKIAYAMIVLCCNQYKDFPSQSNAEAVKSVVENVVLKTWALCNTFKVSFDLYLNDMAYRITNTATAVWNKEFNKYQQERYPDEYQCSQFNQRAVGVANLFLGAILLSEKDVAGNIVRYQNCINIYTFIAKTRSYKYSLGWYVPDKEMSSEGKQKYAQLIQELHMEIKKLDPSYNIPPVKL